MVLRGAYGIAANAWLLRGADSVAMVDTGYWHTADQLVEALAGCGLAFGDVDVILYTHTHEDHVGGALALPWRAAHTFYEAAAPCFADYAAVYRARTPWDVWLDEVLGEGPEAERVRSARGTFASEPLTNDAFEGPKHAIAAEACVELGGRTLRCVAAPGHDPWHAIWVSDDEVFGGDVFLRVPTPILCGIEDELAPYRATVHSLLERVEGRTLRPGHGASEVDAGKAARRAQGFVRSLYDAASEALGEGPTTPLRLATRWMGGQLPASAIYPLMGNAWAQLDELVRLGVAERQGSEVRATRALPAFEELPSA